MPDRERRKAPWRERKAAYLAHLRGAPRDTLLVSACDKLHNARAIAANVRSIGVDGRQAYSVLLHLAPEAATALMSTFS